MPLYTLKCKTCNTEVEKMVSYSERNAQVCQECLSTMTFMPTYRFHGHGLPNGFSATRGTSRDKKDIGGADSK